MIIARFTDSGVRIVSGDFKAAIPVYPDKAKSGEVWECDVVRSSGDVAYVVPVRQVPAPTLAQERRLQEWLNAKASFAAFLAAKGFRSGMTPNGKSAALLPHQLNKLESPANVEVTVDFFDRVDIDADRKGVTIIVPCNVKAKYSKYPAFQTSVLTEYRARLPYRAERVNGTVATVMWHGVEIDVDLEPFLNFEAAKITAIVDLAKKSKSSNFARLVRLAEGEIFVEEKPLRISKVLYEIARISFVNGAYNVRILTQPATKSEMREFQRFIEKYAPEKRKITLGKLAAGFEQTLEAYGIL